MKKVLPIIILITAIIIAVLLHEFRPKPEIRKPDRIPPVLEVVLANKEEVVLTLEAQGNVTAGIRTLLSSEVSGRIVEVSPFFKEGGSFEKGDVLLQIDPLNYLTKLAKAEAEVAIARTVNQQALAMKAQAQIDWAKLGKGKASSLALKIPQLEEATARLKAARANLKQAQVDLDRTSVIAPYSGRIDKKMVDLGQIVNAGGSTPLAEIYSVEYAEVRLPLTSTQISLIDMPYSLNSKRKKFKPAKVLIKVNAGNKQHTWNAVIKRLEGSVNVKTRMHYAVARVESPYQIKGSRPPLVVGQFVEAVIYGKTIKDGIRLIRPALIDGKNVVVVNEDDRLERREVDVLQLKKDEIIVIGGLSEGEKVCVSPLEYVVEGMKVAPQLLEKQ